MPTFKILISPAKSLDFDTALPDFLKRATLPVKSIPFKTKTKKLAEFLRQYREEDLAKMMSITPKLAKLNTDRFAQWDDRFSEINDKNRPAIFTFKGTVYEGINISDFTAKELQSLEDRLIILSGLYGFLTPLTLMKAYRLEMGTKLISEKLDEKLGSNNLGSNNLYQYWGDLIANEINKENPSTIINLASDEYYRVVQNKLNPPIVTPVFKDRAKGKDDYKVVSFWAKKARGLMTRFIIKNKIKQIEELTEFNGEGYYFESKTTDLQNTTITFHRDH